MKKNIFTIITIAALLIVANMSCNETFRVMDVIFPKTSITFQLGRTVAIPVIVIPHDATDPTLTWSSSNPDVATVDHTGKVTTLSEGETMITATSNDGGFKARCTVKVIDLQEIEMIFVEGGTFTMGCIGAGCHSETVPAHEVTLSSFHISKYQVTQKLWETVMGYNPSSFKGENLPVEQVSWNEAMNFIIRLNEITGKNYSFPTEAQWEFAAKGGNESKGYIYSGSNDLDLVAWYGYNTYGTQPVGTKEPNELGIYDMSGNVYEWVNDWFGNYPYLPQIDPQGPYSGSLKVARGGGWFSVNWACQTTFRVSGSLYQTSDYPGFRLALPPAGL